MSASQHQPHSQELILKRQSGPEGDILVFEGVVDEYAEEKLKNLYAELPPKITFDLTGLWRINSLGVRVWIDFMRSLAKHKVTYRRAGPAIVEQFNTVIDFRGMAKIESVLAPYYCGQCASEHLEELVIGRDVKPDNLQVPARKCPSCGAASSFDDLPDRYLMFLAYV